MRRRCLSLLFFLVIVSLAVAEPGYDNVQAGNKSYEAGDYGRAVFYYKKAAEENPAAHIVDYDLGIGYYKMKDYNKAVDSLQHALLTDDEDLQAKVRYNLGNALYKQGIAYENDDLDKAIKTLEQALPHYENVIKADAKDLDAKNNYDFVKKELERLKKKQQQQKNKNNSSQNSSSKNNSSQNNSSNNSSDSSNSNSSGDNSQNSSGSQTNKDDSSSSGKDSQGQPPDQPQGQPGSSFQGGQEGPQDQNGPQDQGGQQGQGDQQDQGGQQNQNGSSDSQNPQGQGSQGASSSGDQKDDGQGAPSGNDPQDGQGQGDSGSSGGSGDQKDREGNSSQNSNGPGQSAGGSVLSPKEAEMILDDFDQNEQPKGLLNFMRRHRDEKPVEKDW